MRPVSLQSVTLLWLLALNVSTAQQAEVRGWTIAYADGRVTTHVLRPRGGMWTPMFPKLTGNGNAKAAAEYGDEAPARQEKTLARIRAARLSVLVRTLTSPHPSLATLRAAFDGLDRSDRAMEKLRADASRELAALEQAGAAATETWVAAKVDELAAWKARCERAAGR